MQNKITPEQKQKIIQLFEMDYKQVRIAEIYGISRERVRQIVYGIKSLKSISPRMKDLIFQKFNSKCYVCGKVHNSEHPLFIHHINGNHNDNSELNLLLVCRQCHQQLHIEYKKCDICGLQTKTKNYVITGNKDVCPTCYAEARARLSERWSTKNEFCVECGKNDTRHRGHGLCEACYSRRAYQSSAARRRYYRDYSLQWRIDNPERWKEISKKAVKVYYEKHKQLKK